MKKISAFTIACFALAACAPKAVSPPVPARIVGADTIPIPLAEMGARTYKGLGGGLFSGSNTEPADHDATGRTHRNAIQPLDVNGTPSVSGRYVLMSVGGGDVSAAWCSISSAPPCNSWSFAGRATSDLSVNHSSLVIVNGAIRDIGPAMWSSSKSANYNRIRDTRLAPLGLSEKQVQVIWMAFTDSSAEFSVTATQVEAASGLQHIGSTIRALKERYPNLRLLFLSSKRYRGFYPGGEPQSYESAFVVRWAIEAQINQSRGRPPNIDIGSVALSGNGAPWISWGPYLWANGAKPRADGLSWVRADFDSTGLRSSRQGEEKVGGILFDFFRSSTYARCWFLIGPVCN
ncbi:MAG: hypothetical protein H0W63_01645 [Gemmatimonadaceae bacterium]|nr:hypothetical protein [Gemmatimonadaceae bacterium]